MYTQRRGPYHLPPLAPTELASAERLARHVYIESDRALWAALDWMYRVVGIEQVHRLRDVVLDWLDAHPDK